MFQGSMHLPTTMSELGRTTGDENTIAPVPYCHTLGSMMMLKTRCAGWVCSRLQGDALAAYFGSVRGEGVPDKWMRMRSGEFKIILIEKKKSSACVTTSIVAA
jgi:hypothetical protein